MVEYDAVRTYNGAIKLANEVCDEGTVDLPTKIVKMEEGHVDWAEIQNEQIKQIGLENCLVTKSEIVAS
jgi:bacterioferritin